MRGKRAKQIRKLVNKIQRRGSNVPLYRKMKKAYNKNPKAFREQFMGEKS